MLPGNPYLWRHILETSLHDFVLGRFYKMDGIDGKVAVITGSSSGLGEATAKLLAERGAKVMLGARREENLQRIVSDIRNEVARRPTGSRM